MKRKLCVIFILAAALACAVLFTACVDNVAYASDMYGTFCLAGNYGVAGSADVSGENEENTPDTTITDITRYIVLTEKDGEPWAYVNTFGEAGEDSYDRTDGYYALYDLHIDNKIDLKTDNRWGETKYTIQIVSADVISLTITPGDYDENGELTDGQAVTSYFVRYDK